MAYSYQVTFYYKWPIQKYAKWGLGFLNIIGLRRPILCTTLFALYFVLVSYHILHHIISYDIIVLDDIIVLNVYTLGLIIDMYTCSKVIKCCNLLYWIGCKIIWDLCYRNDIVFEPSAILCKTISTEHEWTINKMVKQQILSFYLQKGITFLEEQYYNKSISTSIKPLHSCLKFSYQWLFIMPDNIRDKSQGKSELYQNIPLHSADCFWKFCTWWDLI